MRVLAGTAAYPRFSVISLLLRLGLVCLGLGALTGCTWDPQHAPKGEAIIREHVIADSRNDPPIHSDWDFRILSVDGQPVTRETVPPWVDLQRGVLLSPGTHTLSAERAPVMRPRDFQPQTVSVRVDVESERVYDLIGDPQGAPVLVPVNRK